MRAAVALPSLFFHFLCIQASKSNQYYPEELQIFSNPKTLGKHILAQLDKRESRFLSTTCFDQLLEYGRGLLGFQFWAIQLFDSSEKLPSGLLKGHGGALGSFDQCLEVSGNTSVGTINGKYCIGSIELADLEQANLMLSGSFKPRFLNIPKKKVILPWGVCLPAGCGVDDFRVVTLFIFKYSEDMCQTAESQASTLDNGDYVAIAILSAFLLLLIVSTVFEKIKHPDTRLKEACSSFSIALNYKKLMSQEVEENEISCLNGIRAITMIFMIPAMRFLMYPLSPNDNWLDLLKFITDTNNAVFLEAFICVDTFLVVSGTLVSYNFLSRRHQGAKFNLAFYILNRIARLTPVLAFVVLIQTTLMRHYGSGPFWPLVKSLFVVDSCRDYWWTTLLNIQNYYNPGFTSVCVVSSWFTAVNVQLSLLSFLLLWPLAKVPKYTIGFVSALLVGSMCSAFLTSWVYDVKSIFLLNIFPPHLDKYLKHIFYSMHNRASTFIIGFLLGYVLYESKRPKHAKTVLKIFKPLVIASLWVLALGLIALCLFVSQAFIKLDYYWVHHTLQNTFTRPLWAIAVAWIIFACVHGYAGPVNSILSYSGFRILSRILYSTLLINFTVAIILSGQTRKGFHFSASDAISRLWGDLIWTFILGLLLTLLVEYPWRTLVRVIGKWCGVSGGGCEDSGTRHEGGKVE
ncbi:hypothetical protein PPYR_06699 [Photinus pyralis]|uniref:Nose resistant-to-fluoxetine protein N-terminal domain-containing protein n=1 Tax=Photinus pyralis TaxID=7054 RepID=A0A5N4ANB5_PHOPY|nr:nose resistant to fluoxetine protein 6-like [Photinus pyralis]KAB0798819.1 hypothetical protein PPYR_06699 [Photinus pyralis]